MTKIIRYGAVNKMNLHITDEVGKDIDISHSYSYHKDVYAVFVAIIIITLMMVALVLVYIVLSPPSRN